MLEKVKAFFMRDWTLEEKILLLADVVLTGVLLGWLTSPFKGGFFSDNVIETHNEQIGLEEDEPEEE